MLENKEEFVKVLEPKQQAMSQREGAKIATAVRKLLEEKRIFVTAKLTWPTPSILSGEWLWSRAMSRKRF